MRHARLKPVSTDTFMHVYNRTVGTRVEFPFGDCEKDMFISRLLKLTELYVIEVVAYQLMGNHFHVLGNHLPSPIPLAPPSRHCYLLPRESAPSDGFQRAGSRAS